MGTAGPGSGTITGTGSDPAGPDLGVPGPTGSTPRGEIRVEELARRAEVSVDTIRFYQKRQLLPPPRRAGRIAWYGADHVDRLQRIKDLQRQGFSLAVIRRLLVGELDAADVPLAAAVAGAQTGDAELLTLDELAARVGVPAPLLDAVAREGLIVAQQRDGAAGYTAADADVLRAGLRLLEAGFPLPDLLALARQHHDATRAIATDAVEMFDEHVRRPDPDQRPRRRREGRTTGRGVPHPAADRHHPRGQPLPHRAARGRAGAPRGGR